MISCPLSALKSCDDFIRKFTEPINQNKLELIKELIFH